MIQSGPFQQFALALPVLEPMTEMLTYVALELRFASLSLGIRVDIVAGK